MALTRALLSPLNDHREGPAFAHRPRFFFEESRRFLRVVGDWRVEAGTVSRVFWKAKVTALECVGTMRSFTEKGETVETYTVVYEKTRKRKSRPVVRGGPGEGRAANDEDTQANDSVFESCVFVLKPNSSISVSFFRIRPSRSHAAFRRRLS